MHCLTDPEDWKRAEEKFRTRWNFPHDVVEIDGKYIAMAKPKESCSDYNNYKGLLSMVLLALVSAEYRLFWVNVGSSRSSSDAQIFNRSDLREKIKDGTLGLLPPEPLGREGPICTFFAG